MISMLVVICFASHTTLKLQLIKKKDFYWWVENHISVVAEQFGLTRGSFINEYILIN